MNASWAWEYLPTEHSSRFVSPGEVSSGVQEDDRILADSWNSLVSTGSKVVRFDNWIDPELLDLRGAILRRSLVPTREYLDKAIAVARRTRHVMLMSNLPHEALFQDGRTAWVVAMVLGGTVQ